MDGVKISCSIITILNLIVIPISFDLIEKCQDHDNQATKNMFIYMRCRGDQ